MTMRDELGETKSKRQSIQVEQGTNAGAQQEKVRMSVYCTLPQRAPNERIVIIDRLATSNKVCTRTFK